MNWANLVSSLSAGLSVCLPSARWGPAAAGRASVMSFLQHFPVHPRGGGARSGLGWMCFVCSGGHALAIGCVVPPYACIWVAVVIVLMSPMVRRERERCVGV